MYHVPVRILASLIVFAYGIAASGFGHFECSLHGHGYEYGHLKNHPGHAHREHAEKQTSTLHSESDAQPASIYASASAKLVSEEHVCPCQSRRFAHTEKLASNAYSLAVAAIEFEEPTSSSFSSSRLWRLAPKQSPPMTVQ